MHYTATILLLAYMLCPLSKPGAVTHKYAQPSIIVLGQNRTNYSHSDN